MHGGWLFPPPQNIRAPPYAGGGHTGCHNTAFICGVSYICCKIAIWVIIRYSVGSPWGNLLLMMVWVDHVTIEIGLSNMMGVVYVYMIVMMVKWITAWDYRSWNGNGNWKLDVVWSGEHSLVNVIRVF